MRVKKWIGLFGIHSKFSKLMYRILSSFVHQIIIDVRRLDNPDCLSFGLGQSSSLGTACHNLRQHIRWILRTTDLLKYQLSTINQRTDKMIPQLYVLRSRMKCRIMNADPEFLEDLATYSSSFAITSVWEVWIEMSKHSDSSIQSLGISFTRRKPTLRSCFTRHYAPHLFPVSLARRL